MIEADTQNTFSPVEFSPPKTHRELAASTYRVFQLLQNPDGKRNRPIASIVFTKLGLPYGHIAELMQLMDSRDTNFTYDTVDGSMYVTFFSPTDNHMRVFATYNETPDTTGAFSFGIVKTMSGASKLYGYLLQFIEKEKEKGLANTFQSVAHRIIHMFPKSEVLGQDDTYTYYRFGRGKRAQYVGSFATPLPELVGYRKFDHNPFRYGRETQKRIVFDAS